MKGDQESLRVYVSQFNAAALEVYNLDHIVTMTAMKSRLQRYPFLFYVEKRAPADFSKMLAIIEKYASTKEAYEVPSPPSDPIVKEWPST